MEVAEQLGVSDQVEWKRNVPFEELLGILKECSVGLHTMWNEHFGISVVEMQAAGLITVAHDSGGPKLDIVTPHEGEPTGLLAATAPQYAAALRSALTLSADQRGAMQSAARAAAQRFTQPRFEEAFGAAVTELLQ